MTMPMVAPPRFTDFEAAASSVDVSSVDVLSADLSSVCVPWPGVLMVNFLRLLQRDGGPVGGVMSTDRPTHYGRPWCFVWSRGSGLVSASGASHRQRPCKGR